MLKKLSVFSLIMITVVSVDTIRNLPITAMFGSTLVFYYCLAALCFLIPVALVSAELSSRPGGEEGVYAWVKNAYGEKAGFVAIWLQWIENVFYFPTILSFVAGTVGYLIAPHWGDHPWFLVAVILFVFWTATWVNMRGIQLTALFSTVCTITGLLIPMALIIGLGAYWILSGEPMAIQFTWHDMLPHMGQSNTWVSLTGIALSFCGVEIATVHAKDVDNPAKAFPKVLLISSAIILSTYVLGALAIAVVLPSDKISMVSGIMQAYDVFLTTYHLHWLLPVAGLMLAFGGIGGVASWILAPVRGLLYAGEDGALPARLTRVNERGAPESLMLYQAVLVSLLSILFIAFPQVNSAYWLLTVLAAQLYMIMYVMMIVTCLKLRKKYGTQDCQFVIPGGRLGLWLTVGLGLIGTISILCIGFVPPDNIAVGSPQVYMLGLLVVVVLLCLMPLWVRGRVRGRGIKV